MTNQAAQTMPELPESEVHDAAGFRRAYTADQMHQYAREYAASQTAGVAAPGRYFADGPQGHFFADDLQLARDLVNLYDKDDDWTITDLRNPTGVAPAASGGEDDMCPNCVTPWKCNGPHALPPSASGGEYFPGGDIGVGSPEQTEQYRSENPPPPTAPHPDALQDGTLSKSTAKRVEALSSNPNPVTPSLSSESAAPAASGGEDDLDQAARRMVDSARALLRDIAEQQAAASVSERARELLAAEYRSHGWHEDAGRLCMGGDPTSFVEDDALRVIDRLIEQGDEDAHVITELGRLLACIAVILKGPEPAGTAWSYHDLPELVESALSEPRQVAAEMKAWARTRMAEQQSSRRDRMMVSEWAKRLLPESSFPIKDFDVEGMSITKEAAREAVKRVALEQALTQQRGECWPLNKNPKDGWTFDPSFLDEVKTRAEQSDIGEFAPCLEGVESVLIALRGMGDTTPQPSADAVRELVKRWRTGASLCTRQDYGDGARDALNECADELESLLSAASGEGIDDTKRLDWIARQGGYEFDFGILNDQPGDGDWFVHGMGGSGQGATFRDAIDAAIKEEAGGQDANTDILDTLAFKTENGDAGRGSVTYIAPAGGGAE